MKFLIFSILLVILYHVNAQTIGKCLQIPAIPDFDTGRYTGKWYEINRFDYVFEKDLQCVSALYTPINATTVGVTNSGYNTKTQKYDSVNGYAVIPNVNEPNKLLVVLPVIVNGVTILENTGDYQVLETDYETYSLVYSCSQVIPNLLKSEIVWFLSREKTLDQNIIQRLKNKIASLNLDVSKLVDVDQSCS